MMTAAEKKQATLERTQLRLEGAFDFLFKAFVPEEGPSSVTAGEIARAYARINYRFYNDGDRVGGNASTGGESVNAPWRFLQEEAGEEVRLEAKVLGELTYASHQEYEEQLQDLGKQILQYLAQEPWLMNERNEKDSVCGEEYSRPEDYQYDEEEEWDEEDW